MEADDYTVIPIPLLDATVGNTDIVARVSLILDAPLSFTKLRESWQQVVQARPIMQARVRRSKSAPSGLEYHVFTHKGMLKHIDSQHKAPDHLKDFYCLDESHRSITDYCPGFGVGPNAPNQSRSIFVADAADPEDQRHCTAFNGYETLDEMFNSNRPISTIQVTRFSDTTIITFSVSHVIGDLFGIKAMTRAWESALHGTPLPPFEQLGRDPFRAYGPNGELAGENVMSNSPPLPPAWRVYGILDKARLLSRLLWDCHVTRPESTISQKYIFIPEREIQNLVDQAKRDLAEVEKRRRQHGVDVKGPLRVSRSNVLYAWILKHNHANLDPQKWSSPVTISNARAKPPAGMKPGPPDFPEYDWYGASMVVALPSLRAGDLMTMSLGELALHVREGTEEGSSPENARRWLAYVLHHSLWKKPSGKLALWSPPDHHLSGLSDWRLIKISEWDLTPARLYPGSQPVKVCGINSHMVTATSQRNRWVFLGETGGGVWIAGIASEAEWRDPRGLGKYPYRRRARTDKL